MTDGKSVLDVVRFENERCESVNQQHDLRCIREKNHDGVHQFVVVWYP